MNNFSDCELMGLVSTGNRDALDQLFRRYYTRLRDYACQITSDAVVAEDIVQEIFFQLWVSHQKIPVIKSVHAYLKVATLHQSVDHLRKHKPGQTVRMDTLQFIENESLLAGLLQYHNDTVVSQELSVAIQTSIESLPEQCRMVFRLSRTFGMKNAEIAAHLGISVKAVEKHITKALAHLRSNLGDFLALVPFIYF